MHPICFVLYLTHCLSDRLSRISKLISEIDYVIHRILVRVTIAICLCVCISILTVRLAAAASE